MKPLTKNYFRIFILLWLLLGSLNSWGQQIMVTMNVDPNPSPFLLDWAANPQTVFGTATNLTSNTLSFKIKTSISKDGELIAETDLAKMPVEVIEAGETLTKFAEEVIPPDAVKFNSTEIALQVITTGQFPAGNYSICLELVDATNTSLALSVEQCRSLLLTAYQPPVLISPTNEIELFSNSVINFLWTQVTPNYPGLVIYRFKLVEIQEGQNTLIALGYNYPLVDEELINTTQLLLTPDLFEPEPGKQYAWIVQALSETTNMPLGTNEGLSEPHIFSLKTNANKEVATYFCPEFTDFNFIGPEKITTLEGEFNQLRSFSPVHDLSGLNDWLDDNPGLLYEAERAIFDSDDSGTVMGSDGNLSIRFPIDVTAATVCMDMTYKIFPKKEKDNILFNCTRRVCKSISFGKKAMVSEPIVNTSILPEECPIIDSFHYSGPDKIVNSTSWELSNFTFFTNRHALSNQLTNENLHYIITKQRLYDEAYGIEVEGRQNLRMEYPGDIFGTSTSVCAEITFGLQERSSGDTIPDWNCVATLCQDVILCAVGAKIEVTRGEPPRKIFKDITDYPDNLELISRKWYVNGQEMDYQDVVEGEEETEQAGNSNLKIIGDYVPHSIVGADLTGSPSQKVCLEVMVEDQQGYQCTDSTCVIIDDCYRAELQPLFIMSHIDGQTKRFTDKSNYSGDFTLESRIWTIDGEIVEPDPYAQTTTDEEEEEIPNSGGYGLRMTIVEPVPGLNVTHTFPVDASSFEICLEVTVTDENGKICQKKKCQTLRAGSICDPEPCEVSCDNISTRSYQLGDAILLCGNMVMTLTETPNGSNNSLSGKGKVYFPWLKTEVEVEYSGISVNDQNQFCSGEIWATKDPNAPPYPQQWGINVAYDLTEGIIKDVDQWVRDQGYSVDVLGEAQSQVNPVKVPLGLNNANGYTLAFTSFQFTPNGNQFTGLVSVPIDFYDDHTLGFKATGFNFTSAGPTRPENGGFELIGEKTITYGALGEELTLTFKPPIDGNLGTAIRWETECDDATGPQISWCIDVEVDFSFPRRWLRPLEDDGSQVKSNLQTEVCNFKDWLVEIDLPRCVIHNTNGLEIQVETISYDHSDSRNPSDIVFPEEYTGDTETTFHGFWLKQGRIWLPEQFSTFEDPGERVDIQFNHWIINKTTGISGDLYVENVINYPNGNIADLGASIDLIDVKIRNSSLTTAEMKGRILLPVSEADIANTLDYTALFGTGNYGSYDGFLFVLSPRDDLQASLFADGTLDIYESSKLEIILDDSDKRFSLELNGQIDFPDKKIVNPTGIGPEEVPLALETTFTDLKLSYRASTNQVNFDLGNWAFASEQKELYKFPVSIENFQSTLRDPEGNELFRGGLKFDAIVNLWEDRVGGSTSLAILGAVEKPANGPLRATFAGLALDSVSVYADLSAVRIDGNLYFYSNHEIFGNGIEANLKALIKPLGIQLWSDIQFGNTLYGANERYRYWRVGAGFQSDNGIPIFPGLTLNGGGLGVTNNMAADYSNVSLSNFSGATFTPDESKGIGFNGQVTIATPEDDAFNADVTIAGEFEDGGGLSFIAISGSCWVGVGISDRSSGDAILSGTLTAEYDFTEKIFQLTGDEININQDPIYANDLSMQYYIDSRNNEWFFKAGDPKNGIYNTVRVNTLGMNVYVDNYVMFGNAIEAPTSFMPATQAGLGSAGVTGYLDGSDIENEFTRQGKGLAFGVGVRADVGIEASMDFIPIIGHRTSIQVGLNAGAELSGSLFQYSGSCPTGLKGWYIEARAAIWAGVNASVYVEPKDGTLLNPCSYCCINNNPNGCTIHLLSFNFGAMVNGGFPKPTHFYGEVGVVYKIFKWEGTFNRSFQVGTPCSSYNNVSTTGNQTYEQQNAAQEQQALMIRSLSPSNGLSELNRGAIVRASYGFEHNTAFDVAEQQSTGEIEYRTFKVLYSTKLEQKSAGVWNEISIGSKQNLLGEYLYFHNSPNPDADTPISDLEAYASYRFTITAQLQEYNGSSWSNVSGVSETRVTTFQTGGPLDPDEGDTIGDGED